MTWRRGGARRAVDDDGGTGAGGERSTEGASGSGASAVGDTPRGGGLGDAGSGCCQEGTSAGALTEEVSASIELFPALHAITRCVDDRISE